MWDLYRDNNCTTISIPTCTPKKRCYRRIIIIYVLTVYVKIVSKICGYIYLLFNFNNLQQYIFFSEKIFGVSQKSN